MDGFLATQKLTVEDRQGNPISLLTDARHVVKEGRVTKLSKWGNKKYHLVLCNDMIFYAEDTGKKSLRVRKQFPLKTLYLYEPREDLSRKQDARDFQLLVPDADKKLTFRADTPEEREGWTSTIKQCLTALASEARNAQSPDEIPETNLTIALPIEVLEQYLSLSKQGKLEEVKAVELVTRTLRLLED